MSEANEMLPCPHCGQKAQITNRRAKQWRVICSNAGCYSMGTCEMKSSAEAIEAWNRRANRWAAFSTEELKRIKQRFNVVHDHIGVDIFYQIETELARRRGRINE